MRGLFVSSIGLGIGLTVGASVALFSSCGDKSSSDGGGETVTIEDGKAAEISTGQVTINLAAGTLPAGSVVSLAAIDAPTEFSALTNVPAASNAYELTAASKEGTDIPEATLPFTLALNLNEAIALDTVTKTADNVCLLIKTKTKKYVYRAGSLVLNETKDSIVASTKYFGAFQAVFCGTAALEGFEEATGSSAPGATISCDASTKDAGFCMIIPGVLKDDATTYKEFTDNCTATGGTLAETNGSCPDTNRAGTCSQTLTAETSTHLAYYTPKFTEAQAQAVCQAKADDADDSVVTSFTKADGTAVTLTKSATKPLGCHNDTTKLCLRYGEDYSGSVAEITTACTADGGTIVEVCPEADFLDSCYQADSDIKSYFYTGNSSPHDELECTGAAGIFNDDYSADADSI